MRDAPHKSTKHRDGLENLRGRAEVESECIYYSGYDANQNAADRMTLSGAFALIPENRLL